eukprot:COSAG01_NODE_43173_length_432_cov_1.627628_1_plen_50_part_10
MQIQLGSSGCPEWSSSRRARDFFDGKRRGGEGAPGQEHPLQNEWAFWYMR